jgi:hypothetical protein
MRSLIYTSIQALRGKLSVGNYNFEKPQKPYFRKQIRSPYFASQIRGKYGKSVAVNTSAWCQNLCQKHGHKL